MQQRIMIAMALSCNPSLLIADEPTTAVDVTVQAQLMELLNNLREQLGTSLIIITHNLGVVARYADKVVVMYAGRLVESGPTDVIYDEPRHPYTIGLIASVPRLDLPRKHGLNAIRGNPPNLVSLPRNICPFVVRCNYAIQKCHEQRPELEEMGPDHVAACFRSHELPQLTKES
jgi:oligopeptide transport system ATP-binding protein